MDLNNLFSWRNPVIFGRATIGTSKLNVYELAQALDWGAVFNAAYALDITSTSTADAAAGTGARTIRIFGLDFVGNPLSADVTLNGQIIVTTTKLFWRIFGAIVLTSGTGRKNAGDIFIVKTGTGGTYTTGTPGTLTSGVLKMLAGENKAMSGIFTAPRGSVYRLIQLILNDRVQVGKFELTHAAERLTVPVLPFAALTIDTPVSQSGLFVPPAIITLNELEDFYVKATMGAASGAVSFVAGFEEV